MALFKKRKPQDPTEAPWPPDRNCRAIMSGPCKGLIQIRPGADPPAEVTDEMLRNIVFPNGVPLN